MLELLVFTTVPGFYVDAGDLNLGPHTYVASTLTTEPSFQPYLFDSVVTIILSTQKNIKMFVGCKSKSYYILVLFLSSLVPPNSFLFSLYVSYLANSM